MREMDCRWREIEETYARKRLGNDVSLWVADARSAMGGELAWCHADASAGSLLRRGKGIREFVRGISTDLLTGHRVAVGFGHPLFVVVPREPEQLRMADMGTVNYMKPGWARRMFSVASDSASFPYGIPQVAWIMRELRSSAADAVRPTFIWRRFVDGQANLFVWEARVLRRAKTLPRVNDPELACMSFLSQYPRLHTVDFGEGEKPFLMAAAAMTWAGFTIAEDESRASCVVIESS